MSKLAEAIANTVKAA
ncbi:beta-class phenol-soluble modulin, partial [Staphylococcus epidermidis]